MPWNPLFPAATSTVPVEINSLVMSFLWHLFLFTSLAGLVMWHNPGDKLCSFKIPMNPEFLYHIRAFSGIALRSLCLLSWKRQIIPPTHESLAGEKKNLSFDLTKAVKIRDYLVLFCTVQAILSNKVLRRRTLCSNNAQNDFLRIHSDVFFRACSNCPH